MQPYVDASKHALRCAVQACLARPTIVTHLNGAIQTVGGGCSASQCQSPNSAAAVELRQASRAAHSVGDAAGEPDGNAAASVGDSPFPEAQHVCRPAAQPEALPLQNASRLEMAAADSVTGAASAGAWPQSDSAAVQRQAEESVADTPPSSPCAQACTQRERSPQPWTSIAREGDADSSGCASPLSAPSPSVLRTQSSERGMSPMQQPTPGSSQTHALDSFDVQSTMTWRDGSCAADQAVASASVHLCALWDSEAFIQTALHQLSSGTSMQRKDCMFAARHQGVLQRPPHAVSKPHTTLRKYWRRSPTATQQQREPVAG